MNDIGARIRAARLAGNMGQAQLAAALDVSVATISEWENGRKTPSPNRIKQIEDVIGVDFNDPQSLETVDRLNNIRNRTRRIKKERPAVVLMQMVASEAAIAMMEVAYMHALLAAKTLDMGEKEALLQKAEKMAERAKWVLAETAEATREQKKELQET